MKVSDMGSRAIYSITENGKTSYLYGQRAAVYSLPFFFLECIEAGKNDPDSYLSTVQKMTELERNADHVVDMMETTQAERILNLW